MVKLMRLQSYKCKITNVTHYIHRLLDSVREHFSCFFFMFSLTKYSWFQYSVHLKAFCSVVGCILGILSAFGCYISPFETNIFVRLGYVWFGRRMLSSMYMHFRWSCETGICVDIVKCQFVFKIDLATSFGWMFVGLLVLFYNIITIFSYICPTLCWLCVWNPCNLICIHWKKIMSRIVEYSIFKIVRLHHLYACK